MYREAERRILAEINKKPYGSAREYTRRLRRQIASILNDLHLDNERWSMEAIQAMYEIGRKRTYRTVKQEYRKKGRKPPELPSKSVDQEAAVEWKRAQYLADTEKAIASTRQKLNRIITGALAAVLFTGSVYSEQAKSVNDTVKKAVAEHGVSISDRNTNLTDYAQTAAESIEHDLYNEAVIDLSKRLSGGLIHISEHYGSCPLCAPYQGIVYSTEPGNPYYPYLYDTPFQEAYGNFHPRCRHVATLWIEELKSENELVEMRRKSNRSFDIGGKGWTKEETEKARRSLEAYRERQRKNRRVYDDRKQYARYKAVLGDDAPRSFAGFRRMKGTNGETWENLKREYRRVNRERNIINEARTENGRHSGKYADAASWSDASLKKAARSYKKQVDLHSEKIATPSKYDTGWDRKSEEQKQGLLRKWGKDKERNDELRIIMEGILKDRGKQL